jgi:adenylate cyclase
MHAEMKTSFSLRTRTLTGLFIGMIAAALQFGDVWRLAEEVSADWRLRLRAAQPVPDEVRLVGIDDDDVASAQFGWRFRRAAHVDALRILQAAGARHVTLDFFFTDVSPDPDDDTKFKATIEELPSATLAYNFERLKGDPQMPGPRPHFIEGHLYGVQISQHPLVEGIAPVPPYTEIATSYGAANATPDPGDKILRRVALFFAHDGKLYPSLAMQTVISTLGLRPDQIRITPGREVTLIDTPRGTLHIPVDEHCQYRVNFVGDVSAFVPGYNYLDLYAALGSAETQAQITTAMKDRVVVIGEVSTGSTDTQNSPIGLIQGAALQATVVGNILSGRHLRTLPVWIEMLLIIASGALLGAMLMPKLPWVSIAIFVLAVLAWAGMTLAAAGLQWLPPLISVWVTMGATTLTVLGLSATGWKHERSRVAGSLGQYIAPALRERVVGSDAANAVAAERKELTIFFSDIRGFNAWAENAEPDEVTTRLNEYFAAMTPLIERHGGTLDKLIGDCIMAFFGAPAAQEDHARRAVRMALAMQSAMQELNHEWKRRGYAPLSSGMGIHTAFVTVGNFGSSDYMDYTVIGPGVHLTAKIQNMTPPGKIWISAKTHAQLDGTVASTPCSTLEMKTGPVALFEVTGVNV